FHYTDTYRRAIKLTAVVITTEKERLKERAHRTGSSAMDSHYYAELRALEHAMNHVVKGENPRLVVLGERDGSGESFAEREARLTSRLTESQLVLNREREEKEQLKRDLKKVGDAYQKLQAESGELRKLAARLRRKLSQTSSTFGVVGFAMFVIITVLGFAVIRP
ncbi:MAG: hypothetical protein OEZ16_12980, partial [Chromatiales bacterium]|nr:hypothetical protein [Chromatiales bacterium]